MHRAAAKRVRMQHQRDAFCRRTRLFENSLESSVRYRHE
jgi:hypothetical protein